MKFFCVLTLFEINVDLVGSADSCMTLPAHRDRQDPIIPTPPALLEMGSYNSGRDLLRWETWDLTRSS
jgi:hypothetical protein